MGYNPDPSGYGPVQNSDNPHLSHFDSSGRMTQEGMNFRDSVRRNNEPRVGGGRAVHVDNGEPGIVSQVFVGGVMLLLVGYAVYYYGPGVITSESVRRNALPVLMSVTLLAVVAYLIKKLWKVLLLVALGYGAYLYFAPAPPAVSPTSQTAVEPAVSQAGRKAVAPTHPAPKRQTQTRPAS